MGETPKPPAQPVTMGETPKPPAQPVTMGETPKPSAPEETPKPPAQPGEARGPKRRRRRRKVEAKPVEADAEAPAAPIGDDPRVPAFAHGWPHDEALDALVAAFEAGDYARVRRDAPLLARRTESDAVRRAARELARRLDPDPIAVYMLMAAAALLVFLAG